MFNQWHKNKCKSRKWLALGFAASFSLLSSVSYAVGNIAIVTNDTKIESGEELGITLVLGGSGTYDVYGAVTGGILGASFFVFDENSNLLPWDGSGPPPKLRSNVTIENLSTSDKIIPLLPRIPVGGLSGNYAAFGVLVPAGANVMENLDNLDMTTIVID